MCGIVGIMGDLDWRQSKAFEDMLKMDVLRGEDSTGVAFVGKKKVVVVKDIVLPNDLIDSAEYTKAHNPTQQRAVLGHNRYATKGLISEENAHPFRHGAITLVHNGTVHATHHFPDHKEFDTDSETITNSIDKIGIDETWTKLDGAAAILYWDNRAKTLNVITNGKREIFVGNSEDFKQIYIASEVWMIKAALDRRNIDAAITWHPKDNYLFTFKWSNKNNKLEWSGRRLKEFVRPVYFSQRAINYKRNFGRDHVLGAKEPLYSDGEHEYYGYDQFGGLGYHYPRQEAGRPLVPITKKEKPLTVVELFEKPKQSILSLNPSRNIYTKEVTKAVFKKKYALCDFCFETTQGQYETSVIIDSKLVACETCVKGFELNGLSLIEYANIGE